MDRRRNRGLKRLGWVSNLWCTMLIRSWEHWLVLLYNTPLNSPTLLNFFLFWCTYENRHFLSVSPKKWQFHLIAFMDPLIFLSSYFFNFNHTLGILPHKCAGHFWNPGKMRLFSFLNLNKYRVLRTEAATVNLKKIGHLGITLVTQGSPCVTQGSTWDHTGSP